MKNVWVRDSFDQRIEVWVQRVRSSRIGDAYHGAAVVQARVYAPVHARWPTERAQVEEFVVREGSVLGTSARL